jgi:hypothetical protein
MTPHPLLLDRARALCPAEKFLAVGHASKVCDSRLADEGSMEGKGKLGLRLSMEDDAMCKCML